MSTTHQPPPATYRTGVLYHLGDTVEFANGQAVVVGGANAGFRGLVYHLLVGETKYWNVSCQQLRLVKRFSSNPAIDNQGGWNPATGNIER